MTTETQQRRILGGGTATWAGTYTVPFAAAQEAAWQPPLPAEQLAHALESIQANGSVLLHFVGHSVNNRATNQTATASQPRVNHKAIAVLRALRNRAESEQRILWVTLEETLDHDRLSDREQA